MKPHLKVIAFLSIILVSLSCSNDDAPAPGADYFLKAKIDGVQYTTDAPFRVLANSSTDRINITSVLADNRNFEIIIDNPIGIGTYTTPEPADSDYGLSLTYEDGTSATSIYSTGACAGSVGTLIITLLSATEIAGTFSFTGKRTSNCAEAAKSITEGSFKSGLIQ